MKKTLITAALAIVAFSLSAKDKAFDASDTRIIYQGRVLKEGRSVSFNWSNTIIRIAFTGTGLSMEYKDSGCDWFNVWEDGELSPTHDRVIKTEGKGSVVLASGLQEGRHTIILQKRSEGEQGCITISGFACDGTLEQASSPYTRRLEFIGDSYTCGYGTEAADRDQPFRASEENCNLTYAAISGRYFNAEVRTISHSGRGIVRNYDGAVPGWTMPVKYPMLFDKDDNGPAWDPTVDGFKPDAVIIYLGTNDFSTGKQPSLGSWCDNYVKLLNSVRSNYGESVPILCVSSNADETMGFYVQQAIIKSGLGNIYRTSINRGAHNENSDLGASWHPNYSGHRKVASCIVPYISTVTGWELPLKTLE